MGWTWDERLVCALENGTIRLYTVDGEYTQFTLPSVSTSVESLNRIRNQASWIAASGQQGWWH